MKEKVRLLVEALVNHPVETTADLTGDDIVTILTSLEEMMTMIAEAVSEEGIVRAAEARLALTPGRKTLAEFSPEAQQILLEEAEAAIVAAFGVDE